MFSSYKKVNTSIKGKEFISDLLNSLFNFTSSEYKNQIKPIIDVVLAIFEHLLKSWIKTVSDKNIFEFPYVLKSLLWLPFRVENPLTFYSNTI